MQPSNEMLLIDTPENVTFDYDVSGIGSRFLAALVDTLLIFLLQFLVIGVLTWTLGASSISNTLGAWLYAILGLIAFGFFWGYYIFFEIAWNGQTPGKRWTGIRVIRMDGTPVAATEVIIRNLVRIIDLLPTAYGVGVLSMFITDKSRRIGDLAAGTVVVHDRPTTRSIADLQTDRARALATISAHLPLPTNFPIDRITEKDVQLIEEYLLRRYYLTNREQMAAHLLGSLATRLGLEPDAFPAADADELLVSIYRAASPGTSPSV